MRAHQLRRRHVAAMMNVVAIGLVLSTLAAAGVWSPSPPPPAATHHGEHVVREGRRVVIVEYERELPVSTEDGGTVKVKETRVLPEDALDGIEGDGDGRGGVFDSARGVASDAAGKVAGAAEEGKERLADAKESAKGGVLGAVKRCKDRLCGAGRRVEEGAKDAAMGAKEAASRVEHGAEDAARGAMEAASDAKDSVENVAFDAAQKGKEVVRSAKDKASDAAQHGKEAVSSAKDKASDAAQQGKETVKDKVSEAAGKAKEKASDIQHGAAEAAKERVSGAARHAKDTVRSARDSVSDIAQRAEERAEDAAERAADAAAEAEEKAAEVGKNLTDIARRARGVAADAAGYLLLGAPREAARTATAVMHLLGLATAYGACVWVTFVSSHVLAAALPRQQLGMLQSKLFPVYFRVVAYGVALALAAHLLGRERGSAASRAQSFNLLAALGLVLANMLLLEPKATKVMFERMKLEKEEGRGRDMVDDIVDPPVVTVATPAAGTTTTTVPTAAATARTGTASPGDRAVAGGKRQERPAATATGGDAEMSKSRAVMLSRRLKQLNGYSSLCNVLCLMSLTWHLVHLARRLHAGTAC